ncbi:MAG TPA: sugar phosphate isomerase/epimerase family protein [Elusimicrobiota bacterium]|nr:sugar phosphate isomerase/epimerase family protein [Elusimicrobiota bacterium]
MTKPSVYLSSSYRNADSITEIIDELKNHGITHIELSGESGPIDDVQTVLRNYQTSDHISFSIHNYFPPPKESFILNIASCAPQERARGIDFVKNSIRLTHSLGLTLYTIHAGYRTLLALDDNKDQFVPTTRDMAGYDETMRRFAESINEICSFARPLGIRIGIENLFPINADTNFSIMCTPVEWENMFQSLGHHDNLGMLLDLGHLNLASNYLRFDKYKAIEGLFAKHADKIYEIHVSQNDGEKDLHGILKKDSWILPLLRQLPVKDKIVTLEIRRQADQNVFDGYRLLQEVVYDR